MRFIKSIVKNFSGNEKFRPSLAGLFIKNKSIYATDIYKAIKYTPDFDLGDEGYIPKSAISDTLPEKRLKSDINIDRFLDTDSDLTVSIDIELLKQVCETLSIYTKENKIKNNRINLILGDKRIYINSDDGKIKCILMGLI